ncbi:M15 family metallopeptidase [Geitlerinema sp. PCC 9228]|uniref:M15 family metallopeptidase n=1 Tax=Geitlerinema sp. PCC 9228 TaxID=111611 RepID=UPI0031BA4FB2
MNQTDGASGTDSQNHSSESSLPTSPRNMDDIPEAIREAADMQTNQRSPKVWLVGGTVVGIFALGAGMIWAVWPLSAPESPTASSNQSSPETVASPSPQPKNTITTQPKADGTLLGHHPYEEAPQEDLVPVVADGSVLLRAAAAEKFLQMQKAARADGVYLVPLSGFRSIEDQQYLFFEVKAQRGQVTTERAEVSAPPGYSEHHTGYAIDIGDADAPATNVTQKFENTTAFAWLQEHASKYQFELSFPKDSQQVSYEPWHWRFVGNRHSLETFYQSRQSPPAAEQ